MSININNIINNSKNFNKPVVAHGGSSIHSFGIVNSVGNGKRISFSKSLAQKLGIHDLTQNSRVFVAVSEDDKVVLVGKSEVLNHGYNCKLSSSGEKRISYNAEVVHGITEAFDLPFEERTSISISNIEFTKAPDDTEIAVVHLDPETVNMAVS